MEGRAMRPLEPKANQNNKFSTRQDNRWRKGIFGEYIQ